MDYKSVVIIVMFISSLQAIRHQAPPLGNHNKKSSRRSSLVACFDRPICVRFYLAYSPQLMNPMTVNLKYMG